MKTSTKKVIGCISLVLASLVLSVAGLVWWVQATFIDYRSIFPKQLKVKTVIHEAKRTHSMGPSGINNAFVVYELPDKAAAKITAEGLEYLNSLPVTWAQTTQPRFTSASEWGWMATPVPPEQAWLRGRREIEGAWVPSILNFYDKKPDSDFMIMVPPEFRDFFHEAIRSPGNFYSYRGHNTLVVSPSQGKAYFLHRS